MELKIYNKYEDKFGVSENEDGPFQGCFDTEAEAIEFGPDLLSLDPGEAAIYTCHYSSPVVGLDVDTIIEDLKDSLNDKNGIDSHYWLDDVTPEQEKDLSRQLENAVEAWVKNNDLVPDYCHAWGVKKHIP